MVQILDFLGPRSFRVRWLEVSRSLRHGQTDEALEALKSLADDGYAEAYAEIGNMYERGGNGVPQNLDLARQWYLRAIDEIDDEYAYIGMARLAINGYKDAGSLSDAVKYLQKACDRNNPVGLTILGTLYHTGKGVQKDSKQAAQLYERAIAQGYVLPMAYLSKLKLQNGNYMSGLFLHFKTIWTAYRIARKDPSDERLWNYM